MHVHIAPDVVARIVDDVTLARRFAELGIAGFQLKSHYTSTAERARGRPRRRPGGPGARRDRAQPRGRRDERARRRDRGARGRAHGLDADRQLGQRAARARVRPPGAKVPVWVKFELELREPGIEIEPVAVVDDDGACCPRRARCSSGSPHHDLVLATGHLARDEIFAVVDAAVAAGVARSSSPTPSSRRRTCRVDDQLALAERGALLERCFTTPHTGKVAWEDVIEHIRAGGRRAHGAVDRSRPGLQPAGRGRAGADGRPVPRGRLQRRGGSDDGRHQHAPARGRRPVVSRRIQVIGAHSADFVWRAGGAIAVAHASRRRRRG